MSTIAKVTKTINPSNSHEKTDAAHSSSTRDTSLGNMVIASLLRYVLDTDVAAQSWRLTSPLAHCS